MLVLSRKRNEAIVIANGIRICVIDKDGEKIRLGLEVPDEMPVTRQEVHGAIARQGAQATSQLAHLAAPLAPPDQSRPESHFVTHESTKKYIWVPHHIEEARNSNRTCFISYSHRDEQFAKKLYTQMCRSGVSAWYAPEDMKGGGKTHEKIESAIKQHDRLVLVLSKHSMKSSWVESEIRWARKAGHEQKRKKLFPIRLTSMRAIRQWQCFDADSGKDLAEEVREYHVSDFTKWKDEIAFRRALTRFIDDIRRTSREDA